MAVREKQLPSRNQNNRITQKQERNLIPSMIPSTIPTMMRKAMAIVASEDLPSAGAALGQSLPILIGLARKNARIRLMEWREIKRADQKKTIGLWVRNEEHWKERGITHVETYYCPLRNRCGCRAQLRITRAPSVAVLEWSGGPLTYNPRMLQKN